MAFMLLNNWNQKKNSWYTQKNAWNSKVRTHKKEKKCDGNETCPLTLCTIDSHFPALTAQLRSSSTDQAACQASPGSSLVRTGKRLPSPEIGLTTQGFCEMQKETIIKASDTQWALNKCWLLVLHINIMLKRVCVSYPILIIECNVL